MAACYQLVLDRQIGSVCLSDQWRFIAVDTLASARGMRCSTPYSLCNRFVDFKTGPDHTDWCSEILSHWIVPELIAFRCFADGKILPDEKPQEIDANPWAALSHFWAILNVIAKWLSLGGDSTDNTQCVVFTEAVTRIVGKSAAAEYIDDRHLYRTIPESGSKLFNSWKKSQKAARVNRQPNYRIGWLIRLSPRYAALRPRSRHCCSCHQMFPGTSATASTAKGVMHKERREGQND